jgi:hypothetical protein
LTKAIESKRILLSGSYPNRSYTKFIAAKCNSSWPGKSAKRVFALGVPAINVFVFERKQGVDARDERGHDGGANSVIASVSETIQGYRKGLDCFVAFAPRNDVSGKT